MRGAHVSLYIVTLVILASAIKVDTQRTFWHNIHQSLKPSYPCLLHNRRIDCSALFGSIPRPSQVLTQQVTNLRTALHDLALNTLGNPLGHIHSVLHQQYYDTLKQSEKYLDRLQMSSGFNRHPMQVESNKKSTNLMQPTLKYDSTRDGDYSSETTPQNYVQFQNNINEASTVAPLMSMTNTKEPSGITPFLNEVHRQLMLKLLMYKNDSVTKSFTQKDYDMASTPVPVAPDNIKENQSVINIAESSKETSFSDEARETLKPDITVSPTTVSGIIKIENSYVENAQGSSQNTSFSNNQQDESMLKSVNSESFVGSLNNDFKPTKIPTNLFTKYDIVQNATETSTERQIRDMSTSITNQSLFESQDSSTVVPFVITKNENENHNFQKAQGAVKNVSTSDKVVKPISSSAENDRVVESFIQKYNIASTIEPFLPENMEEKHYIQNAQTTFLNTSFLNNGGVITTLTKNESLVKWFIQNKHNITPSIVSLVPESYEKGDHAPGTIKNVTFSEEPNVLRENDTLFESFRRSLDRLERKFLLSSFTKLTAISPEDRKENGISFIQSGLFLHLLLVALSTEIDQNATSEIEQCLGLNETKERKIQMLQEVISWLPESLADHLKFRWSSRLVLGQSANTSRQFQEGAAEAMKLKLSWLNGTETPSEITRSFNKMVENDSGGTMHDTFEEEELSSGVCGVAVSTLYVRGRWRSAPTLLNGSRPFHDAPDTPKRSTRLFRINDVMRYAYLHEWDAEAIEIPYITPGLTLLVMVPKKPSLPRLVQQVARLGLAGVLAATTPMRLAVTLPLYTLRMTLLLPNKLEDMGMSSLINTNVTECHSLKLSHAVQRLMFWAEAGRNAYKDDGIEWDPRPELELVVDRPYLFFVRWHNITLMNGNFVL